jgi:hypothetical protein
MSLNKTIQAVQKDKFNSMKILENYKMFPKHKARMNILFYKMISMLVMHPTLKIDMLKMEQAFQTSYKEGDKVLYVFPLNWKGKEEFLEAYQAG